jgi:hypothetical protein
MPPKDLCPRCGRKCRYCVVCELHNIRASFGPVDYKPIRCKLHKLDTDVTYCSVSRLCTFPGCPTQKAYGPPGGNKLHCGEHKLPGEKNLDAAYCDECVDPPKIACFAAPDATKPTRCSAHKGVDYVDVKNGKCEDCRNSVASYTHEGKLRYCAPCARKQGLQLRIGKAVYCIVCDKHVATFGKLKPEFCKACNTEGHPDVRSMLCTTCRKQQASWGQEGGKSVRCGACAQPSDIQLRGACTACRKATANYGPRGGVARRCFKCRIHGDVNPYVNLYDCPSCGLDASRVQGQPCEYCDESSNTNRSYEKLFALFVRENFANHPRVIELRFNSSRGIGKDCGSRRPDIFLDAGTFFIVVEVDENQHKGATYQTTCETYRSDNITDAIGLPGVFIRLNPHSYKLGTGLIVDTPLADRKIKLFDVITQLLQNEYHDPEVIYLFYDEAPVQKRASEATKVGAFNGAGQCVGKFLSISAAARHLKANDDSICRAVKNPDSTSAGHYWRAIEEDDYESIVVVPTLVPWKNMRGDRVRMVDPTTKNILAVFDNATAAAKALGLTKRSISVAVANKGKSSGFLWELADPDDTVDVAKQEKSLGEAKKQKRFK